MASAFGFQITAGGQGAIFALSGNAKNDRSQTFGKWDVELRKDSSHVAVRSGLSNLHQPFDEITAQTHNVVQDLLDIVAVEERNALVVIEPYNNVLWRTGPHGPKLQLTTGISFAAEPANLKVIVKDPAGNVRPDPPYTPPSASLRV